MCWAYLFHSNYNLTLAKMNPMPYTQVQSDRRLAPGSPVSYALVIAAILPVLYANDVIPKCMAHVCLRIS